MKVELMNPKTATKPPKISEIADRLPKEYRKTFLSEISKRSDNGKKQVRVYSDGCYDMFHFGHMRQLEQIKKMFPNIFLVVGICADKDIQVNKGSGVMNDDERIESVRHCRHVDEILFPAPWHPTLEFMEKHKFDFIAHDTIPYLVPDQEDCYEEMKQKGRFLPTLRTEGVSTSDLLLRILKDRNSYYERNLKKGYSRKDMNLTYLEYLNVQMKGVMHKIKTCIRNERKNSMEAVKSSGDEEGDTEKNN